MHICKHQNSNTFSRTLIKQLITYILPFRSGMEKVTGSDWFLKAIIIAAYLSFVAGLGVVAAKGGIIILAALIALPIGLFAFGYMLNFPVVTIYLALTMAWFAAGVARYVAAPWGLMVDFLLVIGLLGVLFLKWRDTDWSPLMNDVMLVNAAWFGYVVMEIGNPEMRSVLAWFYAMRAMALYQILTFILVFMVCRHHRYVNIFIRFFAVFSIMGTLWGLRQQIFGVDAAEYRWLWEGGYAEQHVLHGVLRVFSFYTDAGQFGASQAEMALVFGIIMLGSTNWRDRIIYGIVAFTCFIGFGISGTRGALAVPGLGALVFLFLTKNFKVLGAGVGVIAVVFYILKFTFAFQGVEQVRRMRTALDPNDPSLQVRLMNQRIFAAHLKTRPLGGGIGSAGYWGSRFSPNTLLGSTPTDSYYVNVWAETGIVGMWVHMFMLGFFLGKGGAIIWYLKDQALRYKMMAFLAGFSGLLLANYGNNVLATHPSQMISMISLPLIFMAPLYDKQIAEENRIKALNAKPPVDLWA